MKHTPTEMIQTEAKDFWMFIDAQRLTCPVCKHTLVYGIDQLYYDPSLLICTGKEEPQTIELSEEIPF